MGIHPIVLAILLIVLLWVLFSPPGHGGGKHGEGRGDKDKKGPGEKH